jgi:quinol monooxygenase YgiN
VIDPYSRGYVRLNSSYLHDPPEIQGNYLTDAADMARLVSGVRIALKILDTMPLESLQGEKFIPIQPDVGTIDAEIEAYIQQFAGTLFHPVGTCRMGPDPYDAREPAVVDAQLRVHDVQGLRVVDASIMPWITSGNTYTPTVMIGEKAADLIKGAHAQRESGFRINMVLKVRERDVERFRSLLGPLVRMPQKGLLRFEIDSDPYDRTRFISSELWETKAAWEARETGRGYQEFFVPQVAPLVLEAKPLEPVASWESAVGSSA